MTAWLEFYATFLLRRPLEAEDYIFPTIGSNGTSVHPDRPLSSDLVQKRITDMANRAGINGAKYFTTHCFRRGGAQYRFMFAPIHQRWTLARIRWWGGWAIGEHVSACAVIFRVSTNLSMTN
jgi:integrase